MLVHFHSLPLRDHGQRNKHDSARPTRTEHTEDVGWLKCCFTSTETVGLLGTGAQDVHLDFHTAPEVSTEDK